MDCFLILNQLEIEYSLMAYLFGYLWVRLKAFAIKSAMGNLDTFFLRHNLFGQLKLLILLVFRCCTFSRNMFKESLRTYRSFSLAIIGPSLVT